MAANMPIYVLTAGALLDGAGTAAAPGSIAWKIQADGTRRIVAVGSEPQVMKSVGKMEAAGDGPVEAWRPGELAEALVLPGLVNAHVHLDLTTVGRQRFDGDFVSWVKMVQAKRNDSEIAPAPAPGSSPLAPASSDPASRVRASVRQGAALSHAAGVTVVGDIAGWRNAGDAIDALRRTGLGGVGFAEIIGLDESYPTRPLRLLENATTMQREAQGIRIGLQPHAPYSTGLGIYQAVTDAAARYDLPLSTHLSEMDAEFEFVAHAKGIFRQFIESLGAWQDQYQSMYNAGQRPVGWMAKLLRQRPWLLAHCNQVNDDEVTLLAECGASVAYCPRASEYFGHRGHRYRQMIEAGVNVCLGTDSIICHGTLSIIDEMRRLHERDGTDAMTLLRMGTINGMRGLGLETRDATLQVAAAGQWMVIEGAAKDVTHARQAWERVLKKKNVMKISVV